MKLLVEAGSPRSGTSTTAWRATRSSTSTTITWSAPAAARSSSSRAVLIERTQRRDRRQARLRASCATDTSSTATAAAAARTERARSPGAGIWKRGAPRLKLGPDSADRPDMASKRSESVRSVAPTSRWRVTSAAVKRSSARLRRALRAPSSQPAVNEDVGVDRGLLNPSLPLLDGLDEVRSLEQRLVGAGVEPGDAAPEQLDVQLAPLQVGPRFTSVISSSPRAEGARSARDLEHAVVVEVDPGHRVVGARASGFSSMPTARPSASNSTTP